jgi:hypothetical protein
MLSLLQLEIEKRQPLPGDFVVFSHPDSITRHNNLLPYFRVALFKSGFRDFGEYWNVGESMFTLRSLDYFSYSHPSAPDFDYDEKPFIVLNFCRIALTTTIIKHEGVPHMVKDYFQLGADSILRKSNHTEYWNHIGVIIRNLIRDYAGPDTELVMIGSQGHDHELLETVQSVVNEYWKGLRIQISPSHVFGPARGAARMARGGMIDSIVGCIPNRWCATLDNSVELKLEL